MSPEGSLKWEESSTSTSTTSNKAPYTSPSPNSHENHFGSAVPFIDDDSDSDGSESMGQLASLTAAASVLENASNHRSKDKLPAVSLPPISHVFPQHFGNPNAPSLSQSQRLSYAQYYQQQQQQPPHQGQGSSSKMYPTAPNPPPNSLNYYQSALNRIKDIRSTVYAPLQQKQQHSGSYSIGYPTSVHPHPNQLQHQQHPVYQQIQQHAYQLMDRKRSFHHHQDTDNMSQMKRSALQSPVKADISSITHGTSTVMHFRNFAIQLSSRSTNLTSNQSGSASADKEHFAAVMEDCLIATSVDFINAFPNYRPVVNNKLKPLKFIEFIQEQLYLNYNEPGRGFVNGIPQKDDLVYFYRCPDSLAAKNPQQGRFKVFRHSRTLGIAIYRNGQRIFPTTPEDISDFWMEVPRNRQVEAKERTLEDIKESDLIMICRGYPDNLETEADVLAEKAAAVPRGGDLDAILPAPGAVFEDLRGESGTVMAVLDTEFDEYILKEADYRIRHVIHVEKNGHTAIDEPWSYAITKHTLLLRPYLALLYSDASKINRFSPTIEFILRKVRSAPLGDSILRHLGKLSEIQHMAGAMIVGDKLRVWSTGGAFLIHLCRDLPKSSEWEINLPGMTSWSIRDSPVINICDLPVQDNDCLLLCCPEIRKVWKEEEIKFVINSRSLWPEKLQVLANRLVDGRNSKNGIGLYEVNSRTAAVIKDTSTASTLSTLASNN